MFWGRATLFVLFATLVCLEAFASSLSPHRGPSTNKDITAAKKKKEAAQLASHQDFKSMLSSSSSTSSSTVEDLELQIRSLQHELSLLRGDIPSPELPLWYLHQREREGREQMCVREWIDKDFRRSAWLGEDYVHSSRAPARILDYTLIKASSSSSGGGRSGDGGGGGSGGGASDEEHPRLLGVAYFSPLAESHKGFCHGGSMCSLMDDICGWTGFVCSNECVPWSGFTVQIDTKLMAPVPVGSLLKIESKIEKREGPRKVWVTATLSNEESGLVHAECRGLFLLSKEAAAAAAAATSASVGEKVNASSNGLL